MRAKTVNENFREYDHDWDGDFSSDFDDELDSLISKLYNKEISPIEYKRLTSELYNEVEEWVGSDEIHPNHEEEIRDWYERWYKKLINQNLPK